MTVLAILVVAVMMLGGLAITIYAFSAAFSAGKEVAKTIGQTPATALQQLGLAATANPAGGQAHGTWRQVPVRVTWVMHATSVQSDMGPHFGTTVSAMVQGPPRAALGPHLGNGQLVVQGDTVSLHYREIVDDQAALAAALDTVVAHAGGH